MIVGEHPSESHSGTCSNDPAVWETVDAHKALIEDKELYAKLHVEFAKAADLSKINMFHVNFEPDANLAVLLNATYTSFAHVSAYKPGHSPAELHAVFKGIVEVPNVPGCLGGAFGKALEKDDYVLLYGWDDPKVCLDRLNRIFC